ncbi:coiled-coil domain-containing protein 157 isoform X2 [Notolabrus celidotus]|uniref:coiled-coil domain-containing protein 157 isoform X2 n=1 Tax=Notolabrus celidotus TaxID=1203425 RepID=UPI00148FFE68|nr:coiled-coil domain-containing protein 157 isoform X2 [Notolabrus celidotus]
MSQFLGGQDCIDSLRRDLVDLQGATLDVFSRTGPVRFSSWKFPDKLSCNLDMVALLEQYDFTDGDEAFSQHSHIVLLELVIDRLLLLLQSFDAFVELMRCGHMREHTNGCQSVGLVVRNCWSTLSEFAKLMDTYKDIKKQTKVQQIFGSDETETVSPISCSKNDLCRQRLSAGSSPSTFNHVPSNPTCNTSLCPEVDSHNSEGLPSSLQPLLVAVEDTLEPGQMTAADVTQWANEQLRDMRRLAKHLQDVRGTVQPLTDKLAAAETERDKFRSQLGRAQKEFKQEIEKHQANIVQLEFSLRKAQRSMKETEQRLQQEQGQLKKETLCLKDVNSSLREKETEQKDTIQALEYEKTMLQEKVSGLQLEKEICCTLQHRVQQLEGQFKGTQLQLDKENAKYHSACRQQESMQAKQTSLLKRVDALDEECEELQSQLGEREQRQISLHNQLQQLSEEKEQVQAQLTQQQLLFLELQKKKQPLEKQVGELQKSVVEMEEYVRVLKERERLLVAFPELSPLARSHPQSTGNVLLDMERQLQANNIRVKILEQENMTLYTSLMKLRERVQNNTMREASLEQTWGLSDPSTPEVHQQNHQMQLTPLQSRSAARQQYTNRWKEGSRGESGLDSAGSGDRVSTAAAVSPSSLQLHLHTLQLNTDATVTAKSCTKTHSGFILSHSRSSNQRRNQKQRRELNQIQTDNSV